MKVTKEIIESYEESVIKPLTNVDFKNELLAALSFARQVLVEIHNFDNTDSEKFIKELKLESLIQFCEDSKKQLIDKFHEIQ